MISTKRLFIREWRDEDFEPFAKMNADARVMEHFPNALDESGSRELMGRLLDRQAQYGMTFWAVTSHQGVFIGLAGLAQVNFDAPFTPAIEIGWRLAPEYWGQGFASEAAQACLDYGFDTLELDRIVSFTAETNTRSWRLMERLGMERGADFIHPKLPADHRLQPHRLYEIKRP